MTEQLRARYEAWLHDPDPARQRLARAQLATLARTTPRAARPLFRPRPAWPFDVLVDLFVQAGNTVAQDKGDRLVLGHEPVHPSRSRACLVIWRDDPHWWCSACGAGGDAIRAVQSLEGCTYFAALARLRDRYGRREVRSE